MRYKTYYKEDFGETYEEEIIATNNIYRFMNDLAEELSYPTHDWWVDEKDLRVYDHYGNEYYFEEIEERYRVGVENEIEHIDYWEYKENELELAQARYDSIILGENERKYLIDLETLEYLL